MKPKILKTIKRHYIFNQNTLFYLKNANVVGKFDDYNEIFSSTIDLDLMGHGIIKVKSTPNNITCKGKGWVTFIPAFSYLLGTCKGQKGEAELTCDDSRTVTGDWILRGLYKSKGRRKNQSK